MSSSTYQPTQYSQVVNFVSQRLRERFGRIPTDEELGMAVGSRHGQTLAEVKAEFDRVDAQILHRTEVIARILELNGQIADAQKVLGDLELERRRLVRELAVRK